LTTTPLNDLTHRLTMLAAAYGYTVSVRMLGGTRGSAVELRATRLCGGGAKEYTRQVSLRVLANRGRQLAADFVREARVALAAAPPADETVTRARPRQARHARR
jgi:hypothetical protein